MFDITKYQNSITRTASKHLFTHLNIHAAIQEN